MIKVLKKVDAILGFVAANKDKATLVELSRQLKIHKATLSHILQTLSALGYIDKNIAKCYSIGPRVVDLAEPYRRQTVLQEVAAEYARALAGELRESISVSILHDGVRYRIARASVNRSITVESPEEARGSLYDAATGRLLMAYLDRDALRLALEKNGFPGKRWNGMERSEALNKQLAGIRRLGLAFWRADDGQVEAVAAPVFGPDKKVWAAIGVGVPAFRFRAAERRRIIGALKAACEQMSFNLTLRCSAAGGGKPNNGKDDADE